MAIIAIDGHTIGQQGAGNERYVLGLLEGLSNIDLDHRFLVYTYEKFDKNKSINYSDNQSISFQKLKWNNPLIRLSWEYPRLLDKYNVDIIHFQYAPPAFCKKPLVLSIHDVLYEKLPGTFNRSQYYRFKLTQAWFAKKASVVLTLSKFSKSEICRVLNLDENKVQIIYPAVLNMFKPLDKSECLEQVKRKFNIAYPFLLYVGSIQPRKNLNSLFRIHAELVNYHKVDIHLVIAGKNAWLYENVYRSLVESSIEDKVHFLGYVSDNDLVNLYNTGELFLYPSLMEGFGIPPVEAMACGLPVIVSNTSCFPEIIKDACILLDPDNIQEWVHQVLQVLSDDKLKNSLVDKGLVHSKNYSSTKFAKRMLNVYNMILG